MIPWREQVRMLWKAVCWFVWTPGWPVWLNVLYLITLVTGAVAAVFQLWLAFALAMLLMIAGVSWNIYERTARRNR